MEVNLIMNSRLVHRLTFSALLAAAYAALTMATGFMSYGYVQLRIAEAFCILPFFFPFTTWGLFIGCVIANLLSPVGIADVVFGSLATLLACLSVAVIGRGGRSMGRCIAACAMPVLWNAVIVGAVIAFAGSPVSMAAGILLFPMYAGFVALGEAAVMFIIGLPLMRALPKKAAFRRLCERLDAAI